MHYTCQVILRLCSVRELRMFTYLCVHFSVCVLVITSNRRLVFVNIQSVTCECLLLYFSTHMYFL